MSFWTIELDRALQALRADGNSFSEIAEELSLVANRRISRDAVMSRLRRAGGSIGTGSRTPAADVSAILPEARAMLEAGHTWYSLAKHFGCNWATLRSRLDPEFAQATRDKLRQRRAEIRAGRRPKSTGLRVVTFSEARNPIYDPKRDGVPEPESFTAQFLGDPFPGRAELMRRAG